VTQPLALVNPRAFWDELVSPGKIARLRAAPEPPPLTDVETRDPARQRLDAYRRWVDCSGEIIMGQLLAGADIEDAVDCVFDDDDWRRHLQEYFHWTEVAPPESQAPETLKTRFPWAAGRVVSPPNRQLATRCVELLNATFIAHEHLFDAQYQWPCSRELGNDDALDPLWFLSDPAIPAALRTGLLNHRRGAVAVVSTYPYTRPAVRPDTFGDVIRLVKFAKDSLEKYLRVLANIPEAGVSIVGPDQQSVSSLEEDIVEPFRVALRNGAAIGASSS